MSCWSCSSWLSAGRGTTCGCLFTACHRACRVSCRRARRSLPRLRPDDGVLADIGSVPSGKDRRRDHAGRLLLRVEQLLHRRAWRHAPGRPAALFTRCAGGRSDSDRAVLRCRRRHRRRRTGRRRCGLPDQRGRHHGGRKRPGPDSGGCDRPVSDRLLAAMAGCRALPRDGRARRRCRARPAFSGIAPRRGEVAHREPHRSGRSASTPPASTTASRRSTKPTARSSSATSRRSRT